MRTYEIDYALLGGCFADTADEVIELLSPAREQLTGEDQQLLDQLVSSANSGPDEPED